MYPWSAIASVWVPSLTLLNFWPSLVLPFHLHQTSLLIYRQRWAKIPRNFPGVLYPVEKFIDLIVEHWPQGRAIFAGSYWQKMMKHEITLLCVKTKVVMDVVITCVWFWFFDWNFLVIFGDGFNLLITVKHMNWQKSSFVTSCQIPFNEFLKSDKYYFCIGIFFPLFTEYCVLPPLLTSISCIF